MPDPQDVEVERDDGFGPRAKPAFEERLMRALSAIHGDLARIADASEQIAKKFDGAGQIDPIAAATARLGELLGGRKNRRNK